MEKENKTLTKIQYFFRRQRPDYTWEEAREYIKTIDVAITAIEFVEDCRKRYDANNSVDSLEIYMSIRIVMESLQAENKKLRDHQDADKLCYGEGYKAGYKDNLTDLATLRNAVQEALKGLPEKETCNFIIDRLSVRFAKYRNETIDLCNQSFSKVRELLGEGEE